MMDEQPTLRPPNGKRLIVQLVMNVECWTFDKPLPRKLLSTPYNQEPVPDIPNYCWVEYGLRIGMSRFIDMCAKRNLPVMINLNSAIISEYPKLAAAMREMNWEIVGHGVHHRMLFMEKDERAVINQCLDEIEAFFGGRPRGWLGPGLAETFDTPEWLKLAGIDYVYDWVLDDYPDWIETKHGRLVSVPYGGLDLNDVMVWMGDRHVAAAYHDRIRNTVATFEPEMETRPRFLTLALHPHVACVPHRMPVLIDTIDWLLNRNDTMFMTGSQVADWFIAESTRGQDDLRFLTADLKA
jgi:peptidoglycan/xylan/chitin deacetylase (PgdA/CDA1 family)